jgi:hypothetical protein
MKDFRQFVQCFHDIMLDAWNAVQRAFSYDEYTIALAAQKPSVSDTLFTIFN